MLAGPIVALAWFLVAPPADASAALPPTYLVATSLAAGAAATGATQVGAARAFTATLGAGLFGALVVVILGVVMAGERQVGSASPTLAHAFAAAVGRRGRDGGCRHRCRGLGCAAAPLAPRRAWCRPPSRAIVAVGDRRRRCSL